jgi:hypothetical protein
MSKTIKKINKADILACPIFKNTREEGNSLVFDIEISPPKGLENRANMVLGKSVVQVSCPNIEKISQFSPSSVGNWSTVNLVEFLISTSKESETKEKDPAWKFHLKSFIEEYIKEEGKICDMETQAELITELLSQLKETNNEQTK